MTSKKHRMIVYAVAAQLLIVAIVCYAAFPVTPPEQPLRLVYQTNAGKVLFDHQTHTTSKGYGLACSDCHHPHGGEEIEPVSCSLCHPPARKGLQAPETCLDCHSDASEYENPQTLKRADALHKQCIGCHDEFGKGPQTGSQGCSQCHVL